MSIITIETVVKGASKAKADLAGVAGSTKKVAVAAGTLATAALGAGAAIGAWIDKTVDAIDEMDTLSKSSGLAIETVNGLRHAATAAGKSLKEVVPLDLAKKMRKAQEGSTKAKAAFSDLGVSVEDLNSKSPDEVLGQLLDGLAGIEDPGERAALAFETMGTQGQNLLSTLGDSGALEHFIDLGEEFGTKVGPEATAAMGSWRAANAKLNLALEDLESKIQPIIGPAGKQLSKFVNGLYFSLFAAGGAVANLAIQMHRVTSGQFGKFLDEYRQNGLGFQKAINDAMEATYALNEATKASAATPTPDPEEGASGGYRATGRSARAARLEIEDLGKTQQEQAEAEAERLAAQLQMEAEHQQARSDALAKFTQQSIAYADEYREKQRTNAEDEVYDRQWVVDAWLNASAAQMQLHDTMTGIIIDNLDTTTKKGRDAAMALFIMNKAGAIGQLAVDAAVAIGRQYRDMPIYAAIPASIAVGAVAAANIATVAAEQPSFHIGTRATNHAPDEYQATLRSGESVVTAAGREAITEANAGVSSAPPTYSLSFNARTLGEVMVEQVRDPVSAISQALRRNRTRRIGRAY